MHKGCLLAWESAPATTVLLQFAPTATTGITHTLARLTAITARTTLWVACLSARVPGITVITGAVSTVVATTVAAITGVASTDGILIATAVLGDAKASSIVGSTVVASGAVIVASMAADGSTEAPLTSTPAAGDKVVDGCFRGGAGFHGCGSADLC